MKIFLLMIQLHILDDFVLQSASLAKLKQKRYWEKYNKESNDLYKYDYLVALFIHSLSWSILVHLPIVFGVDNQISNESIALGFSIISHTFIHAMIDDDKANHKKINLLFDQLMHFLQILSIYLVFTLVE